MNQAELKNTVTEMKNTLAGINNRLTNTGGWICDLDKKAIGN